MTIGERVVERGGPSFGVKFKDKGHKMFHIFHSFYNLLWFLAFQIPFRENSLRSPVRKVTRPQSGQYSFSRVLNADWLS